MRVCYFGTYRTDYSRNRIMIAALRHAGAEVVECNSDFWPPQEARVRLATWGWMSPAFWWRLARARKELARKWKSIGRVDVILVGYPGQLDVFQASRLARQARVPIVWDVFMSLWLLARERGLHRRNPIATKLMHVVEWLGMRRPDKLLLDTPQHADWMARTYDVPRGRIEIVPTGADEGVFHPQQLDRPVGDPFRVLYYGSFIHNHGVRHIIEAARLLREETDIRFDLIGDGPEKSSMLTRARNWPNVHFHGWATQGEVAQRIAGSDVCLGAFGNTQMAQMTIHNKVFEAMASGTAVVTGDSPAVRGTLRHRETAYLAQPESGEAIAQAIRQLKSDDSLRRRLALGGLGLFRAKFGLGTIGRQTLAVLAPLVRAQGRKS